MSVSLDPREVLSYLNELGYTNITAHQLKDFLKDLKKIIKYEQRKQQQKIKPPLTENICELNKFATVDSYTCSTSTASFKNKEIKTRENIITVEVKRPQKSKCNSQPAISKQGVVKSASTTNKETNKENIIKNDNCTLQSKISKTKSVGKVTAPLKPTPSFIRPRELQLRKIKSDPVALYHQYQSEWKKMKFPGEDARSQLRWAIRQKMIGGDTIQERPFSTATSLDVLVRKKQDTRNV